MNPLQVLLHPRQSLRRWRTTYELGRQMLRLQTIPFRSGLGDSAWMLYSLARSLKPEVCVEIGSARGKSACYIARALTENGKGKLYAIDPHTRTDWNDDDSVETYEVMRQNLEYLGLSDRVEMIRKTSQNAARGWDRTIDLIFIDGDHSYEGVKRDWELFVPHVSPFGVVVFHDTAWDIRQDLWREYARDDMGVPRLVDELRLAGYPVITLTQDFGISMVQPQIGGAPLRIRSTESATVG